MFYQIFLSPQVKRIVIISNKHGIYVSTHEFQKDLTLRPWAGFHAHTRKKKKKKDLGYLHDGEVKLITKVVSQRRQQQQSLQLP